jgi:leucyl aminopeptidase
VIESIDAIARLGLPVRVTAVVPATENSPDGNAMRPGDIVTASNGTTIEVNNTDAEGRLVLADALVYVVRDSAERIVDLATLTGAITVALGSVYSGLFANDDDWLAEVQAAGDAAGEIGWRMPLHPEFEESLKGQFADIQNASDARGGKASFAAEFLRQFVDGTPWVHVDIAGTAWGNGRAYVGNGAAGYGTRMLIELATRMGAA